MVYFWIEILVYFSINTIKRGVEYNLNNLKKEGKLKRTGLTKSGSWETIKQIFRDDLVSNSLDYKY